MAQYLDLQGLQKYNELLTAKIKTLEDKLSSPYELVTSISVTSNNQSTTIQFNTSTPTYGFYVIVMSDYYGGMETDIVYNGQRYLNNGRNFVSADTYDSCVTFGNIPIYGKSGNISLKVNANSLSTLNISLVELYNADNTDYTTKVEIYRITKPLT